MAMPRIPPYKNRSLKDIPSEKWKDIPEFVDYYQLSNYGRVKALERWVERVGKGDLHLKEAILKLSTQKKYNPFTRQYYFSIITSLCRNAKRKGLVVGRMVYYLFVRNFDLDDRTLSIVTKDGNKSNLHYKNLELVKKGMVQEKVYEQGKKKRPTKLISQYDYQGKLIQIYPSILAAAKAIGGDAVAISQVAHQRMIHHHGYLWQFGTKKKIKGIGYPFRHVKRIAQYTVQGKLVRQFNSITEAEEVTGFDDIGIAHCAKGRRKLYKGFQWKYVDQ